MEVVGWDGIFLEVSQGEGKKELHGEENPGHNPEKNEGAEINGATKVGHHAGISTWGSPS